MDDQLHLLAAIGSADENHNMTSETNYSTTDFNSGLPCGGKKNTYVFNFKSVTKLFHENSKETFL